MSSGKQVVAVVSADLHLRPYLWANRRDIFGDTYFAWVQLVELARERGVPLVLLGDVFDSRRPDPLSVKLLQDGVDALEGRRRCPLLYLTGNHDNTQPPWCELVDGPVINLEDAVRRGEKLFPFPFGAWNYRPAPELRRVLQELPRDAEVFFCHQSWQEIQQVGHADATLAAFPQGGVLYSGDCHQPREVEVMAADGSRLVAVSPGSPCPQAIDQTHAPSALLLLEDGSCERVPLSARRATTFEVQTEEALERLVASAPRIAEDLRGEVEWIAKPIVRIKFDDGIAGAARRLSEAFAGRTHLMLVPMAQVDALEADRPVPEDARVSLLDVVAEFVPRDSRAWSDIQRLLQSENPQETLRDIREQFMDSVQKQVKEEVTECSVDS